MRAATVEMQTHLLQMVKAADLISFSDVMCRSSDIVCDTCAFHGHGNGLVRRPQEIPASPAC